MIQLNASIWPIFHSHVFLLVFPDEASSELCLFVHWLFVIDIFVNLLCCLSTCVGGAVYTGIIVVT